MGKMSEFSMRVIAVMVCLAILAGLLSGCKAPEPTPTPVPELTAGMVDTTEYKKEPPWKIGRAGCGDTNSWMVSFSAHFDQAFTEKYADLVEEYYCTAAMWDPTKQISDVEDLLAKGIDLPFEMVTLASMTSSPSCLRTWDMLHSSISEIPLITPSVKRNPTTSSRAIPGVNMMRVCVSPLIIISMGVSRMRSLDSWENLPPAWVKQRNVL